MSSYRIVMTIGSLAPGVGPEAVLPAAAGAARDLTTVEAYDVSVVSGEARIHVRFTAETTPAARSVADHVRATTGALVTLPASRLERRYGGRWLPV